MARVSGTSLTGTWRYWNGSTWVLGDSSAIRLPLGITTYGVSNEFSVHRIRTANLWVLITHGTTVASENGGNLSDDIVAYLSCSPAGPFVAKTFLYDTPETEPSPGLWAYNSHSSDVAQDAGRQLVGEIMAGHRLDNRRAAAAADHRHIITLAS